MSSTIQTPPVITTEIEQPTPFKVVIEDIPVIKTVLNVGGGQGPAGRDGISNPAPSELEYVALVGGAQSTDIGMPFHPDGTSLFKNGVRQPRNSYSLSTSQLHLPDELEVYPDDVITFLFYPIS